MAQFIYLSKFSASPEATKRQQMHFEADVNFAYSEDYSFIKSSDNLTFQIVSPTELVEVDVTEEELQALADNLQRLADEQTNSSIDSPIGVSEHTLTGEYELDVPFFEDVARCYKRGIKVIEDVEGYRYTITSATSVTGIIPEPEEADKCTDDTVKSDDYCIQCHNIMLIDQIINNTLLQTGTITTSSCDNMLKLAHLKQMLKDC